jgi:hypothetical protein
MVLENIFHSQPFDSFITFCCICCCSFFPFDTLQIQPLIPPHHSFCPLSPLQLVHHGIMLSKWNHIMHDDEVSPQKQNAHVAAVIANLQILLSLPTTTASLLPLGNLMLL